MALSSGGKSYFCILQHFRDRSVLAYIAVKQMGDLDTKPFREAMKRKYSEDEVDEKALELCSLWEENLKDPSWHPFKVVTDKGNHKACISGIHKLDNMLVLLSS